MRPLFRRQEKAYAMPVGLLEGIADRESRFRHDIVSGQLKGGVGEAGVMQLHPAYHLSDDRERIDPNIAIPYAAKYLAQNFLKFGTWEEAIAAYNWGPGNLERSGLQAAPTATKEYIAWVKDRGYVEGFV
jgi:soluble lytic murein transglycosylase-like protein